MATQDWSRSELGPPSGWPHTLRLTLDIMLNTPLPMLLMWSRRQVMLYNKAYADAACQPGAPVPGALIPAMPPSAWSWNPPAIEQAWAGRSQFFAARPLQLWRAGALHEAAFDLHYTPLREAGGAVAGILCTLAPPSAPPAPAPEPAPLRILVVEDNLDAQYLVCEMLRTFGHTVQAAARAEDALAMLEQAAFDVLFSDVSLPGMSGVELGRHALRLQPRLRVVFASGYSESLTSHLDYPAASMQKPYTIEQLQHVLHGLR